MINKIGILYNAEREEAFLFAKELEGQLKGYQIWSAPINQQGEEIARNLAGTDLVLSLGGDGTLLGVVHAVLNLSVPILGVNMGGLGFISEITPDELKERLTSILKGEGGVEERSMLQATLRGKDYHALNDIVLARGGEIKLIHIKVVIDGEEFTTYRADGVILATATGSTAYNLSAGGPILYPWSEDFILKPIFTHPGFSAALVLPADAQVELELVSKQAILAIDGQTNIPVGEGERVKIKRSQFKAKLLKLKPRSFYYRNLREKLLRT